MADAAKVLFLTGELASQSEADRLAALLDLLAPRGIAAQALCTSAPRPQRSNRLFECPGLNSRWARLTAARRADEIDGLHPPNLLHALTPLVASAVLGLAERWRVPYLLTVGEFLPPGGRLRISRRWARGLVVPCEALATDLARSWGVPRGLVTIVPPGVVVPERPELARSGDAGVTVIGAAAPLQASTGLGTFLQAAKFLVEHGLDVEFVIAGRGPGEVSLRALADRLGITARVTFVSAPDEAFWAVLDVFCQTSLVPTAGQAMLQALASGVPVVSTDVEGARALLDADRNTHRFVAPADPDALAGAIVAVLNDREQANCLASAVRTRVSREFSLDREAEALASLFQRTIELRMDSAPSADEPAVKSARVAERQPGASCPGAG